MPQVEIKVGNRTFEVACQEGEEAFLKSASELLDAEAQVVVEQVGRIPEARMLLMSGLMLADRTAELAEKLNAAEVALARAERQLREAQTQPQITPGLSADEHSRLEKLVSDAEAVADAIEKRASATGQS